MSPSSSISVLQLLQHQLQEAHNRNEATRAYNAQGELIHVPGMGKAISSAYEQLRNAAEYTEEHLLLQRAVRRFYHRSLSFFSHKHIAPSLGEELILELTQAGYLQNNSYGKHVATQIYQLVDNSMHTYWAMRDAHVGREKAADWTLDELSVTTEEMLNPHYQLNAVAYSAYHHYMQVIPRDVYTLSPQDAEQYEICLYIAVQQALLKSDIALVRHTLLQMYQQTPADLNQYITFNTHVSSLYVSPLTERLQRAVSRAGAPMRVLKSLAEAHPTLHEMIGDRDLFMTAYDHQVRKEYKDLTRRLNKGIIKSIAFIFITKVIIGLGVEVPYDLIFVGSVAMLPLIINLAVPPLYMAGLKLGLRTPSAANATALNEYIERVLYQPDALEGLYTPANVKSVSATTKLLYSILFMIPFAITLYILSLLHFNVVQGVIFFVFLSTASFLGFRLARMIRELELLVKQRSIISTLRDFFYLPFILVGQWLSRNYAKVNAVAFILDMAIELPMKTMLRLFRQWKHFLNEKHDELVG